MRTILIILLVLGFFFIKALLKVGSKGFEVKGGKVYYYSPKAGVPFLFNTQEVKGADANTFKEIRFPFAKDAQHIFRYTEILEEMEAEGFEILDKENLYSKDKKVVYFGYRLLSQDAANFEYLGDRLAKDKAKVYWKNEIIEGADPISFENLGHGYSKDKNRVFFEKHNQLKVVQEANAANFILDPDEPKKGLDGAKLFYEGNLISRDKATFKKIDENYAIELTQVFYKMEPIKEADPSTFEVVNGYYSKDRSQVYFMTYLLQDARPTTFQVLKEFFSHDGKNLYHRSRKIEGGDGQTLEVFSSRWAKDKNHVYLEGYIKEDLEAATFRPLKGGYVRDDYSVYFFENKLKKVDIATFRIEGEYPNLEAFDKNHRYVGFSAVDENGVVLP